MKMTAAILALWPAVGLADDWMPLNGAGIMATLADNSLIYSNAEQQFYASGRTLYNAGQDSWGYWVVRGDQYCSQWPPADRWDCYDMETRAGVIRFIGNDDSITDGIFVK